MSKKKSLLHFYNKYKFYIYIVICIVILLYLYFNNEETEYKFTNVKKILKHENECRRILTKLYNKAFVSIRPDWLKNPKTGKNLELDCYNEEIKLALEYNGRQHRVYTPFFHKRYEDFLLQVEHDEFKKQRCKELNIDLISVPDTVKFKNLENYIIIELKKINRL